ncbi:MAG TPA: hypothetical protein DCZ93_01530 [Elusimicrobia bacterium]|nr:hypothetical protein [Elusimicrobiota bacterium]
MLRHSIVFYFILVSSAFTGAYAETRNYTKWHPGHYALLGKKERDPASVEKWLSILPKEFAGIKTGFTWRELEPEKDKYDFSRVEKVLKLCEKYNKHFALQLMERCFSADITPLPDYIYNDSEYHGGAAKKVDNKGEVARLWDRAVIERLNKLMRAMGERFNKEPMFEAIIFNETALGIDDKSEMERGFSGEGYLSGLKSRLLATKKAFPNTVVLQYVNWPAGMGNKSLWLLSYCHKISAGIGSPDLEPHNRRGIPAYKHYPLYAGKMPLAIDVQTPEISGEKGYFNLEEFYDYGVNTLKVNYLFWVVTENKNHSYSFSKDLVPFILKKQGRINVERPKNIGPQL